MAAGAWTPTDTTRTKILNGTFDFDSDTWLMALFTSSSNIGASSTAYSGLTGEVANGSGYATGGESIAFSLSGTTTVTLNLQSDAVWSASGGDITGRFAVIYESGGDVAFYCLLDDSPADVTATDGNTLTVGNGSGVATLS
jgi:hypothetical protein